MGLIADIVESVKDAFGQIKYVIATHEEWADGNREKMIEAMQSVVENPQFRDVMASLPSSGGFGGGLAPLASLVGLDPREFLDRTLNWWSDILNAAISTLNIDAPDNLDTARLGDADYIQSLLRIQGGQAQDRVAWAVGAINLVLALGNAISIISEAASAGTVRSIAEAVQSWIWANGLGQLSSMAYQPQLDASVNPLLTRLYNQRSQTRIPSESDLIRFQLREVYEPERRAELLVGESRDTFNAYMEQNGFSEYHADSYWAAHWFLPSIGQLNEMLHRGFISRAEWERFVRFNDYDPSSVARLGEIIYRPFTRVDARRMSSVGVLTDHELLSAYADLGYYCERVLQPDGSWMATFVNNPDFNKDKAQALVVWTKMFNALPILRSRYRNGWITSEQLREELAATGLPAEQVTIRWQMLVKAEKEQRTAPEKDLTRALVVRGWKERLLAFQQARFLLVRMGYDEAEAELILRVQSLPESIDDYQPTLLGTRLTGLVMPFDREPEELEED